MNLNISGQTIEQCVQEVKNIGHTRVINICNDNTHIIPWGSMDWILLIMLISLIGIVIFVVISAVRDFY